MLVIREAQLEAFRRAPMERFVAQLVERFERLYPDECAVAGRNGLRRLVESGIERAEEYGYETERDIGFFIALIFILGFDFDDDPQIPWAFDAVVDQSIESPSERIVAAYDRATEYLEATVGESNGFLVRALIRIREYDVALLEEIEEAELVDRLAADLRMLYPEKADHQGEEATLDLVEHAISIGRSHGLDGGTALGLCAVILFMLGSGAWHDPLYPWVSATLGDRGTTVEERAGRLHHEMRAAIRRSLSSEG